MWEGCLLTGIHWDQTKINPNACKQKGGREPSDSLTGSPVKSALAGKAAWPRVRWGGCPAALS